MNNRIGKLLISVILVLLIVVAAVVACIQLCVHPGKKGENQAAEESTGSDLAALQAYSDLLAAYPAVQPDDEDYYSAVFSPEENLSKYGKHFEYAAVRDLNNDGLPELLCMTIYNFRWEYITVYTYAEGRAAEVGQIDNCHAAAGQYDAFFCEDGHIHNRWTGNDPEGKEAMLEDVYLFDGSGLVLTECVKGETDSEADRIYRMHPNDADFRSSLLG